MSALHSTFPSEQIWRLTSRSRQSVLVSSSMGFNQKPLQHRPIATAPANQLEQAVGAMELLGNSKHPTLQQQRPVRPVTGEEA
jgi:hypothetical protein